MILSI
jgi:hypothetical protein